MKFKIVNIVEENEVKTFSCVFEKGDDAKELSTQIGKPEIDSDAVVLNLIAAMCDAAFGGDGAGVDRKLGSELILDQWYEI